ncbi:efflux RND transporter permease subunit [Actibacterium sp. 188UL27-1]|uniref:efflux RND transporter permease subunit n=1 Tax=Actibacterium sp. 188UL27-1 TaxID=2786961 RepID=UPI0019591A27|nr:efflux RND transporter permease subunit [Actibacterium sp. 188UL27-1]MBM7066679.1 efflux RND transporter permease subunit [Actibacterium sp. 188UL27-1]
MTGIVDWAASRARMVIAFIILSLLAGTFAYIGLPKEGEPDIEIPAAFISVPFPGISAEDSEKMLVKVMETEMADLDGLKEMSGTASEGYAFLSLEFEFGWDKEAVLAEIRAAMDKAEAKFPDGADAYTVGEFNFSEFPIIIINLSGNLPERTLLQVANDLQDRLESQEAVLDAALAGHRDEMLEVIIDPLKLESYNVTAAELVNVVVNNNQLIAAGEVETEQGAFSVKIPSSFDEPRDVYNLPVKTNGDMVITLGDLAEINLTFEDREGTARFNGDNTVALQVSKRKGYNLIDTATMVRQIVAEEKEKWPDELQEAVIVGASNDQSYTVSSMVSQLEGSVLTAIALVMVVVLASLGLRPALLVGFAIPTSFLLCFAFLAVMGISVSNIVMFGLILAVGMLVDGAIVVVEYADKRMAEGEGPMRAYVEAAKRMFWPIVSSTATTLCAFLPMLFWPGVPGEFMGMLPVTLIFVLSASLVVALVYLPVMGGVSGRIARVFEGFTQFLKALPWLVRAVLIVVGLYGVYHGALQCLNPGYLFGGTSPLPAALQWLPGVVLFFGAAILASSAIAAIKQPRRAKRIQAGYRRTGFGWFIHLIAGNPIMPIVAIAAVGAFVVATFGYFGQNNNGVEFFVTTEPEQAIVYVKARGNMSLEEKDVLVQQVEEIILDTQGIDNAFAFAGAGGLNANTGGASGPLDAIGQVQIELVPWNVRPREQGELWGFFQTEQVDGNFDGDTVLENLENRLATIPGIQTEVLNLAQGPASGKALHLRLAGDNLETLEEAVQIVRAKYQSTPALIDLEDTLPLPGIDWEINVDVEKAGRYGADVATVGAMVQLVTRGIMLDTMRVDTSDEEIDIRVRLPDQDRVLSTLDTLKVRTPDGLVPLSNFITRKPVAKLGRIDRVGQSRIYDMKADVAVGFTSLEREIDNPNDPGGPKIKDRLAVVSEVPEQAVTDGIRGDLVKRTEPGAIGSLFGATVSETHYTVLWTSPDLSISDLQALLNDDAPIQTTPINGNERIGLMTEWLETETPLPAGISWEWTGDQEDQEESGAFLQSAFAGALGLMFIILLAQFNSFYNATLVLLAVVLSTTGVLIGMLVMDQSFSIIMTGTGIVALAGIVVNNNIVLIDTYQEYSRYMPRIEAITRTAEARIRPVLLTTITTMAGLAPMMFGLSLDFFGGGYTIDSPTALWWKQLATAVVFGLGIATVLTLIFTPSMLAIRVWVSTYVLWIAHGLAALSLGRQSEAARDWVLQRQARQVRHPELIWDDMLGDAPPRQQPTDTSYAAQTVAERYEPQATEPESPPPAPEPVVAKDTDPVPDPNAPASATPLRAAE